MVQKMTLTELQQAIRDSLYLAFPSMYWVTAEIAEITQNYAGHCYLELIEKNKDEKNIRARIKAIIWCSRFNFIKSYFENISGDTLRTGLRILVKVKIEYHEVYGLSVIICDIDPSYTIGEMALKRQMIIRKLEEEGIFSMNKDTAFPLVPQRIAVISSKNAAGYTDFLKHLNGNSFGYAFHTCLFETVMQGNETEESVIRSLERVASDIDLFDVVVIIRGGGSQADLSWFDNYNIAYYVTQFPLPVITGIGHDKDISVTDMVAYDSLRTPTAVADYLVSCVNMTEGHINQLARSIIDSSKTILEKNRSIISSFMSKLQPVARLMLAHIREDLSEKILEVVSIGKEYIVRAGLKPANLESRMMASARTLTSAKGSFLKSCGNQLVSFTNNMLKNNSQRMTSLENTLEMVRPENVLKRGYSITSLNGRIIKSSGELNSGELIDTRFSDGSVKSRVVQDYGPTG